MFLRQAIELIAPPTCAGCGREGAGLCSGCVAKLVRRQSTCFRCNRLTADWRTCVNCRRLAPVARVYVATYYEGEVKQLVWAAKFRHDRAAASALANLLTPLLDPQRYDTVAAVPSAPGRQRRRGYNQAELMAKRVARALALPCRPLLGRLPGAPQVGADRQTRLEQIRGKMFARGNVAGLRVLLIDDVLTTGATLAEAAAALKAAGAKSVEAAAVAKH